MNFSKLTNDFQNIFKHCLIYVTSIIKIDQGFYANNIKLSLYDEVLHSLFTIDS